MPGDNCSFIWSSHDHHSDYSATVVCCLRVSMPLAVRLFLFFLSTTVSANCDREGQTGTDWSAQVDVDTGNQCKTFFHPVALAIEPWPSCRIQE